MLPGALSERGQAEAVVYGIRPTRTFEQAVVKYLNDYQHKKSLERDVCAFKRIMPHIGDLTLDRLHLHLFNILTTAWKRARERAELPGFRVHDLRHTFGHRLRAAGVGFEDRQDSLGHKSERITTHYSAPDIARLVEAAEKVCERRPNTVLRVSGHTILTQSGTQKDSGRKSHLQVVDV